MVNKGVLYQTSDGEVLLKSGITPNVGDEVLINKTGDDIVTHGVSNPQEGDKVILQPTVDDIVALSSSVCSGEMVWCRILGNETIFYTCPNPMGSAAIRWFDYTIFERILYEKILPCTTQLKFQSKGLVGNYTATFGGQTVNFYGDYDSEGYMTMSYNHTFNLGGVGDKIFSLTGSSIEHPSIPGYYNLSSTQTCIWALVSLNKVNLSLFVVEDPPF